jgi:hypothetical protein
MFDEGKRDIKYFCVLGAAAELSKSVKQEITKMYDYETLSEIFPPDQKEAHAIGKTLTETSKRCPPEPRITPSTGATSV